MVVDENHGVYYNLFLRAYLQKQATAPKQIQTHKVTEQVILGCMTCDLCHDVEQESGSQF